MVGGCAGDMPCALGISATVSCKAPSLFLWVLLNKTDSLLSLRDICWYKGGLKQGRKLLTFLLSFFLLVASGSSGRLQTASCVSLQTLSPMLYPKAHPSHEGCVLWEEPPSASCGWAMCNQEKALLLFPHPHLPATLGLPGLGSSPEQSMGQGKDWQQLPQGRKMQHSALLLHNSMRCVQGWD